MKKIIISLLLFFALALNCAAVDVMPSYVSLSNTNTLGVYQVGNTIVLRSEPDDNAPITKVIKWNDSKIEPAELKFSEVFVVLIKSKGLALMAVTDENEDWVELLYNNETGERGWMRKDDPLKFSTWYNFYSMYGRKYGLYILTGSPKTAREMRGSTDDNSKVIADINTPVKINLNVIRGNWMLLSVMDMDGVPKTGYVRWRSDDGVKYLFPAIK